MKHPIHIANDHGGFQLKQAFCAWLVEKGYEVTDHGCTGEQIVRYPFYAAKVAAAVSRGPTNRGILICSTGIGMSIAANKYPGVRASLCTDAYLAKMTRLHNDSNVLCLGGKTTGVFTALDILETWLTTDYMGGRHDISLGLLHALETQQLTSNLWTGENETEYPFEP